MVRVSTMTPMPLLTIPGRKDPSLCIPSHDFVFAISGRLFLPSGEDRGKGVASFCLAVVISGPCCTLLHRHFLSNKTVFVNK